MTDSSVDEAAEPFLRFEKDLRNRGTATTKAADDYARIKTLHAMWHKEYKPRFVTALGEHPGIEAVNEEISDLRSLVGKRIGTDDLRRRLRSVGREIDNILVPAYEASRWSEATVSERESPRAHGNAEDFDVNIAQGLDVLHPELGASYRQARRDLADASRATYVGPAGELREVLRGAMHALTPDEDAIKNEQWFKGHQGAPTQAERIRFAMQQKRDPKTAIDTLELVEEKVGLVGRRLYSRGSGAFHAGTDRDEVLRIAQYVDALLSDLLS